MAECRRPRVYVDERERGSGVPEALSELGAAVIYTMAGVGDYIVSDRVAIERKTVYDLAESLFDGRLFDQVRRLSEHYDIPVILVEGNPSKLDSYTSRGQQVRMALASIAIDYGVRVLWSLNQRETARMIYSIACREQYGSQRSVVVHRKPRLDKLWMQQLYVVQSLPGVGPRLAEKLLEKLGSIDAICRASVVELERVLGYERAQRIYRVLHAPYKPPGKQQSNK